MKGHAAFYGLILIVLFSFSEMKSLSEGSDFIDEKDTDPETSSQAQAKSLSQGSNFTDVNSTDPEASSEARNISLSQGTDCSDVKSNNPNASSGVYWVQPKQVNAPFKVYCNMRSDGAWTVFQRRSGPRVKFNRNWDQYENGFGNISYDHWLGLQKTAALIQGMKWTLRVDLWDHEGNTAFAEYSDFRLGNSESNFRLQVHEYRGTAGDALRGTYRGQDQNGFGFSTVDRDNDGCDPWCLFGDILESRCTDSEGGGWWYSGCGSASLHGDYHPAGDHIGWASGLHWNTWKREAPYSLKGTRMMVKPENMTLNQV